VIIANNDSLLIDFGSAVVVDDDLCCSHDGKCIGTTKYMPPEVLSSGIHSFARDMWAFGIVVMELVFEVSPICGSNEEELNASIEEFLKSANSDGKPWLWLCSHHANGLKCGYHCQQIQDLLKLLLTPNPQDRITAEDAINFVHNAMKSGNEEPVYI